jgi:hypothetical protein
VDGEARQVAATGRPLHAALDQAATETPGRPKAKPIRPTQFPVTKLVHRHIGFRLTELATRHPDAVKGSW